MSKLDSVLKSKADLDADIKLAIEKIGGNYHGSFGKRIIASKRASGSIDEKRFKVLEYIKDRDTFREVTLERDEHRIFETAVLINANSRLEFYPIELIISAHMFDSGEEIIVEFDGDLKLESIMQAYTIMRQGLNLFED